MLFKSRSWAIFRLISQDTVSKLTKEIKVAEKSLISGWKICRVLWLEPSSTTRRLKSSTNTVQKDRFSLEILWVYKISNRQNDSKTSIFENIREKNLCRNAGTETKNKDLMIKSFWQKQCKLQVSWWHSYQNERQLQIEEKHRKKQKKLHFKTFSHRGPTKTFLGKQNAIDHYFSLFCLTAWETTSFAQTSFQNKV